MFIYSESSCLSAFMSCNKDPSCRLRLAEMINSCVWNKTTNKCDRNTCTHVMKRYLVNVITTTHSVFLPYCVSVFS